MESGFLNGVKLSSSGNAESHLNGEGNYVEPAQQITWQPRSLGGNNARADTTFITNFHGGIYPVPHRMTLDNFLISATNSATANMKCAVYQQVPVGSNQGIVNRSTPVPLITSFVFTTPLNAPNETAITEFELFPGRCVVMMGLQSGSSSAVNYYVQDLMRQQGGASIYFLSGSVPISFLTTIPASSAAPVTLDMRTGGLGDVTESNSPRSQILINFSRTI
jgi:hypothetical protein